MWNIERNFQVPISGKRTVLPIWHNIGGQVSLHLRILPTHSTKYENYPVPCTCSPVETSFSNNYYRCSFTSTSKYIIRIGKVIKVQSKTKKDLVQMSLMTWFLDKLDQTTQRNKRTHVKYFWHCLLKKKIIKY